MLALASCGSGDQSLADDEWYQQHKDVTGPPVTATWVRSQTVRGVRLGMPLEEAIAILRKTGGREREVFPDPDPERPWLFRYGMSDFPILETARSDLASANTRPTGPDEPEMESISLYVTPVNGQEIVSGIDYVFHGKIKAKLGLGVPTKTFKGRRDSSVANFIYSQGPEVSDLASVQFMETCNLKDTGGDNHLVGALPSCGIHSRPDEPFIHIQSSRSGLTSVRMRDASIGRKYINSDRNRK